MRGTALPSSIPHPHVPGWSRKAKVLPRHRPAPAGHRGLLPRPTRTLLLHQLQPHAGGLQELTNILPVLRSRGSCGLAAAYPVSSAHLSHLLSAARKHELKKPKPLPRASEAGCCYLTASAHSPAQTGDTKAGSFYSARLGLPRDNFTLGPTWSEPPPLQRCHRDHHRRLASAQLRRWCRTHLCLWWAV